MSDQVETKKRSKYRPSNRWKGVESAVSKYWPRAKRRGADYKNREGAGGKNDVVGADGWSIEIKHSKSPYYKNIVEAVNQAEKNRDNPTDIPIAVIHKHGERIADSLVVMRLETFSEFFIEQPGSQD